MRRKANEARASVTPSERFGTIDRDSVKARVYALVKEALMRGEFEPGQVMTIDSIAQAFGTSHMPVREALGRLVTERALVVLPNRSVAVPPISAEALRDLMEIRAEVEGFAGHLAAQRITEDALSSLQDHLAGMAAAIAEDDVNAYLSAHQKFHFSIYAGSGSLVLTSIIEGLWLQSGPYLSLMAAQDSFHPDGSEHDAIMRALTLRDPGAARTAIQRGINYAYHTLEGLLPAGPFASASDCRFERHAGPKSAASAAP